MNRFLELLPQRFMMCIIALSGIHKYAIIVLYSGISGEIHMTAAENNTWVSIIIPIYNAEKYLKKCLDSIAVQTLKNFEVILVDDGSMDSSHDICKKYASADSRFKYYRIPNGGSFNARVYGVKLAKGEYFTFCDADDYYNDKSILKILFDKTIHLKEASVIQFGYIKKYNHIKTTVRFVEEDSYCDKEQFYLKEYPKLLCSFWDGARLVPSLWNKLYKRTLIADLPEVNDRVFWGDDLILNLYLLQDIDGILFIPDVLYVYRQTVGGTSSYSRRTMQDLDNIKKYQLSFLDKRKYNDTSKIKSILYSEMAGWFLYYLKESKKYLTEDELVSLINNTLELPRFKLAHDYYKNNTDNWEPVRLLRKADPEEYVKCLCSYKTPFKSKVAEILKMIVKKI